MRVLVAPHNFEIGGSQINALELASAVARTAGFDVVLYAPDGELAERARQTGLELHLSVLKESAPSPLRIRELFQLVGHRRIDLVHAYEWAPTVDAALGVAWARGVPVLSTVLSMDYPYFLPKDVPTILGTREMWETAGREGRRAFLIEPPVDTETFRPDAIPDAGIATVRSECLADDGDVLIVVVGRLSASLKLDGLLALIEAVGHLSREHPVRLAIVGDGPVRGSVESASDAVNRSAHRNVVSVLGSRHDPLPYYAAADIVVGMGSSALRAMAVGKPLLVQGEKGFWQVADEVSSGLFESQGWYGVGNGERSVERCAAELRTLLTAPANRLQQLSCFGRDLVQRRYSLTASADYLASIYQEIARTPRLSKRSGMINILRLNKEIGKYHMSIRLPWLRAASRRLKGI